MVNKKPRWAVVRIKNGGYLANTKRKQRIAQSTLQKFSADGGVDIHTCVFDAEAELADAPSPGSYAVAIGLLAILSLD